MYEKRKPGLGNQVKKALIQSGYDVDMIHYGRYQKDEFREKLRRCEFAVVLSQRETQGIALAEMWAMNVPTLCWESFVTEFNGILIPSSSCPYLTRRTGWRWRNIPELEQVINSSLYDSPEQHQYTLSSPHYIQLDSRPARPFRFRVRRKYRKLMRSPKAFFRDALQNHFSGWRRNSL